MEGMNIFKWHRFLPNIGDTFPQFGWSQLFIAGLTRAAANRRRSRRKLEPPWLGTHNLGMSQTSVPFRHNGHYLWIVLDGQWWSFRLHLLHSYVPYGNLGSFPWFFFHSSPSKDPGFSKILGHKNWLSWRPQNGGLPGPVDQVSQTQGRAPASVTEVLGPTRQATRFFLRDAMGMVWEHFFGHLGMSENGVYPQL